MNNDVELMMLMLIVEGAAPVREVYKINRLAQI